MFFSRVEIEPSDANAGTANGNASAQGRTDPDGDVEMEEAHGVNGANGHQDSERDTERRFEDLNGLFLARYDTSNAGPKMESSSYVRICVEMRVDADRVVFLSDNVNEIRAAKDAGMKAIVVERPGNAPLSDRDRAQLDVVQSLEEIEFDGPRDTGVGAEPEKVEKEKPKRKRQSREDSSEPKSVRRSKRLSHE